MVHIIDAPCGSGKTTWAEKEVNEHPDKSYVFCTPFLSEIQDMIMATRIHGRDRFSEPQHYLEDDGENKGCTKIDSFNALLEEGKDICVTHSTFLNATPETIQRIRDAHYTLILDEAIDALTKFNDLQAVEQSVEQKLTSRDIHNLSVDSWLKIDERSHLVSWIGDTWEGGKFSVLEKMARWQRLYYVDEQKCMMAVYPVEMWEAFDEVYVMTYMFNSCTLQPYFRAFGIDYELLSVEGNRDDGYKLVEWNSSADFKFRDNAKSLITVIGDRDYNRGTALSINWYTHQDKVELGYLQRKIKRQLKEKMRADARAIMWTCPQRYREQLKGRGYTCTKPLTKEQVHGLSDTEREEKLKEAECFVPCNARATDRYAERWALAYCCNMHPCPEFTNFFYALDTSFDKNAFSDAYAIGCLIQWIWRSRIRGGRDSKGNSLPPRPIQLYLPSGRMRKLLDDWFEHRLF